MAVKLINMAAALLVAIGVALCLFGLPAQISDYAREPEDTWSLLINLAFLIPILWLCIANARKPPTGKSIRSWQLAANIFVILLLLALLIIGRADPVVPPIIAALLAGPIAWFVGFARRP